LIPSTGLPIEQQYLHSLCDQIGAGKHLLPISFLTESIVLWEILGSTVSERGTLNNGPANYSPERIQIDGDRDAVDVGATLEDVVGVASYNFGEYEIIGNWEVKAPSTIAPAVTSLENSGPSLLIGSYNVLNLEVVDDLSTSRFALIAQHIVTNMGAPDILGLQEIQDKDGASGTDSTVTSASLTLQTIISLNQQLVDNTLIGDDTNGG
jgi:predicted extracellular nuclease